MSTYKRKISQLAILSLICIATLIATSFTYAAENESKELRDVKLVPNVSLNTDGEQTYTTDRTDAEIEKALDEQMQSEINAIISAGKDRGISLMASSRPTYTTTHGTTKNVKAPYNKVAGQPTGGTQITKGGSIYVDWSGGTSFSISVAFPAPFNKIGISATPGKKVTSAKGVAVNIPASKTQHYLVYIANTYKCRPYIVYKVVNGKKSVYYKGTSKTWYRSSFDVRKS